MHNELFRDGTAGSVTAVIRTPNMYGAVGGDSSALGDTVWSTRAYYQAMSVGTYNGVSGVHFWGVTPGMIDTPSV